MKGATHPVEPVELMAYLDGEVTPEAASRISTHVQDCQECRRLTAEFRTVGGQMKAWEVEPVPASLVERFRARPGGADFLAGYFQAPARFSLTRMLVWGGAAAGVFLVLFSVATRDLLRSRKATMPPGFPAAIALPEGSGSKAAKDAENALSPPREVHALPRRKLPDETAADAAKGAAPARAPMIARTAAVIILVSDVANGQAAVEQLAQRHGGYLADLSLNSRQERSRRLTATLQVPAARLHAALADLRRLGTVEEESHASEDVTAEHVDLVARITNARHTEQRLVEILRQRPGKVGEVLEVEREIARVRGEIERMEAQRKNLEGRVAMSAVRLTLTEERRASIGPPAGLGTRLWNGLARGLRLAADSVVELVIFLLNYGPATLVWLALLFFPVRFAWRRLHRERMAG